MRTKGSTANKSMLNLIYGAVSIFKQCTNWQPHSEEPQQMNLAESSQGQKGIQQTYHQAL